MVQQDKSRRYKRIFALIWSGLLVVIIVPIIGCIISFNLDNIFGIKIHILFPLNLILALIILCNGFFWAIWSNVELYRIGKGSPVPLPGIQTEFLVAKGPYKYTRNPMIFGYIFIWIGLGFLFNSFFLLFGATSFFTIFLILFVKLWEEKNLEERFGESYNNYKKNISFLIPLPEKN